MGGEKGKHIRAQVRRTRAYTGIYEADIGIYESYTGLYGLARDYMRRLRAFKGICGHMWAYI